MYYVITQFCSLVLIVVYCLEGIYTCFELIYMVNTCLTFVHAVIVFALGRCLHKFV